MVHLNAEKIVFGGASLSGEGGGYGFGFISEESSEALILQAFELGVRMFDTAPIYGFGLSEERLGRYLPKEAQVISKGGVDWHPSKRVNMTNDPKVIEKMFLESLKRLKRDYIDIYMIHWPDKNWPIEKSLAPLIKQKQKGYLRSIGLANFSVDQFQEAQTICDIDYLQIEGSYLKPDSILDFKKRKNTNLSIQSWGTFGKGILTGRVTSYRQFDKVDARSWAPWWKAQNLKLLLKNAELFLLIANDFKLDPAALSIIYNLDKLGFNQVVAGFKSVEDLNSLHEISNRLESYRLAIAELSSIAKIKIPTL